MAVTRWTKYQLHASSTPNVGCALVEGRVNVSCNAGMYQTNMLRVGYLAAGACWLNARYRLDSCQLQFHRRKVSDMSASVAGTHLVSVGCQVGLASDKWQSYVRQMSVTCRFKHRTNVNNLSNAVARWGEMSITRWLSIREMAASH